MLVAGGCKTIEPKTSDVKTRVLERFEVFLHLQSDEELKKVMHQFNHLQMAEVRNVTDQPVQLIVSISCADYEIDGFVKKIGTSEGVVSARRFP